MMDESRNSVLMTYYKNQRASKLNNDMNTFGNVTSFASRELKTNAWAQGKHSDTQLHEKSLSPRNNANLFKRLSVNFCSPRCNACFLGLIIGSLLVGIAFAAMSTILLKKGSTNTSTTPFSPETISTTRTSTIVITSTTSTTTTTQASAVARSSLTVFCGCSGFTLSLSNLSFSISNATYQWQSSPTSQNIWSNVNMSSSSSSLFIGSQTYSSDYQCQIIATYPSPMNLTSTIVTLMTTTNTSYCQTRLDDCHSFGDDINNFILLGELGTQINDIATNCSANSYDNRTEESVSLYEGTNYTALVSTEYSGGGENLAIYIDFNNNFQFETSEQVASQLLNMTYNTDVIIDIPLSSLGATIGIHRMRATLAFSATPNHCGTSSVYGETHDYSVNILSLPG